MHLCLNLMHNNYCYSLLRWLCLSHRGDRVLCSDLLLVSSLDKVLCHGFDDGDHKVDYNEEEDPAKVCAICLQLLSLH